MSIETNNDYSNTIAIVGAGAAGCVLANRILANTDYSVLLLERGQDQEVVSQDLTHFPMGLKHSSTDWLSTVPQSGLNNRNLWLHTAKGVGGNTLLNAGVFMFGSKKNYANWPGKFFTAKKFEQAAKEVCKIHQPQTPSSGLMPTDTPAGKIESKVQEKFGFQGMTGKELLWIEEDGIYLCKASAVGATGDGARTRRSVAESFLPENLRADKRLTLVSGVNVTRLLTHKDENTNMVEVTGLECETYTTFLGYKLLTKTTQLTGFREVVLSCGALRTPRLLMASGIGPPLELEKAKVAPVLELESVGQGLWDHAIAFFPVEMVSDGSSPIEVPKDFPPACSPCDNNVTIKTYDKDKKVCFYHMGPQVSFHVPGDIIVPRFPSSGLARRLQVLMLDTLRNQIYPPSNTKLGVAAVGLLTSTSSGSVGWNTLDPGYFSNAKDLETFADAFGDMMQMLRDAGLKIAVPDFDMNPPNREAMIQAMCMLVGPFWHLSGSCSRSVNPNDLKVKGTTNLRIVDASIIPHNIEANMQGPTMLTAYVAGDLF